ncbi:hypothetical protein QQ045_019586 [Rhodiola kirilowii]
MSFIISKSSKSSSTDSPVTKQVFLKSSSDVVSDATDKEAILQRLRYHKRVNRIRDAVEALLSSGGAGGEDLMWLNQQDVFSSP